MNLQKQYKSIYQSCRKSYSPVNTLKRAFVLAKFHGNTKFGRHLLLWWGKRIIIRKRRCLALSVVGKREFNSTKPGFQLDPLIPEIVGLFQRQKIKKENIAVLLFSYSRYFHMKAIHMKLFS